MRAVREATADAEKFVGSCQNVGEMDAELERLVKTAGAELDAELLQLFSNRIERQVMAYGNTSIGKSASHIRLDAL